MADYCEPSCRARGIPKVTSTYRQALSSSEAADGLWCQAVAMQALTNLSINIRKDQIQKFVPVIPHCLNRLWVRGEVNLNALRLLVNLSCCPDMVPYLLGNKSVSGLLRILDTDREEVLIRAVTWILCTTSAVDALNLTYDRISEHNLLSGYILRRSDEVVDPFRNPSHTLYYSIYGPKGREELETQAKHLTNHSNKDVARLLKTLANVIFFILELPMLDSYC
ncbi:unnamed protein product [Caenorhabditis brenneri]